MDRGVQDTGNRDDRTERTETLGPGSISIASNHLGDLLNGISRRCPELLSQVGVRSGNNRHFKQLCKMYLIHIGI